MLKVENINKSYDGNAAVDDLSFILEDGEFLALLGPSGCGKSTSLKMIAGLETPDSGSIILDGKNITHLNPGERKLAMVFQSYALFPHLSVEENILFGLKARKVDKREQKRRLDSVVELVALSEQLHKKPSQLSGGQCQRVALARAIVAEADLCLMDEPLSNLDAKLRNEMRVEIRALQQRLGMSVIYVTHDQVEAMSMADKIVLMNDGKVEQVGLPEELYNQPKTKFAAQFIGSPPMNLINKNSSTIGIRPEHIDIVSEGDLSAQVISCDYHGADTIILAQLIESDNQTSKVKIRYPGHAVFAPGQTISIQWNSEHQRMFSD